MICENCGAEGAKEYNDPYLEEIAGDLVKVILCYDCFVDRMMMI